MQTKKTYKEVNPELLYHGIRDFTPKQGAIAGDAKMETYVHQPAARCHLSHVER
ncbi:hypothetical protein ACFLTO_03250 [Chloroflexota bacterium]